MKVCLYCNCCSFACTWFCIFFVFFLIRKTKSNSAFESGDVSSKVACWPATGLNSDTTCLVKHGSHGFLSSLYRSGSCCNL